MAEYLSTLESGDIDAMESYLAQMATEEEDSADSADRTNLAQTAALDESLADVANFLAQLEDEDIETITTYLAQELSSSSANDDELLLA